MDLEKPRIGEFMGNPLPVFVDRSSRIYRHHEIVAENFLLCLIIGVFYCWLFLQFSYVFDNFLIVLPEAFNEFLVSGVELGVFEEG